MGIDIYARWDGMTKREEKLQYMGFDIQSGHLGYLREAYHGEPYATMFLLAEAFEEGNKGEARIPAKVMRIRLKETIRLAIKRAKNIYNEDVDETSRMVKSYIDFVELCEEKERLTGKPVKIIASY